MAKKFGKFLTLTAFAGIAAGIFYYLKNKNTNTDAFDDFDDDLDDENTSTKDEKVHSREYVSIRLRPDTNADMGADSDTTASDTADNDTGNGKTNSDADNKENSIED